MGEDDFLDDVLRQTEHLPEKQPDLASVIKLITEFFGRGIEELRAPSQCRQLSLIRAYAAWAVVEFSSSTLTEFGALLSRDVSTLSSAVRRLQIKALTPNGPAETMKVLRDKLAVLQVWPGF